VCGLLLVDPAHDVFLGRDQLARAVCIFNAAGKAGQLACTPAAQNNSSPAFGAASLGIDGLSDKGSAGAFSSEGKLGSCQGIDGPTRTSTDHVEFRCGLSFNKIGRRHRASNPTPGWGRPPGISEGMPGS
jgi:hypothetical protein